jgi:hypothetical protein
MTGHLAGLFRCFHRSHFPRRAHEWGTGVNVSDPRGNSSEKKSYQPPQCTQMSIFEIGILICKKTLDMKGISGTPSARALTDVQVLIVEGYSGDLPFISQTTRTPARQSGSFWLSKGDGFVEMRFVDEPGAVLSEIFLLFDLRLRHPSGPRVLQSMGENPELDKAVPHVILATSLEQVHSRLGIDPKHCWQLRNCPSPVDLMSALRSFLHLSATLMKWIPEEGSARAEPAVYALTGNAKERKGLLSTMQLVSSRASELLLSSFRIVGRAANC